MPNSPATPLQTAFRLAIMLGTLTVGSMGYYRYGPEPDALAEMIDQAASMVVEIQGTNGPEAAVPAGFDALAEPAPFETTAGFEANPVAPAPRYDSAVQPASALQPVGRNQPAPAAVAPLSDALERERLTAPLLAVGATRANVTSWGQGNQTLFRATASTPVGNGASGLERRFDTVGESPEAAVAQLVQEIRTAAIR